MGQVHTIRSEILDFKSNGPYTKEPLPVDDRESAIKRTFDGRKYVPKWKPKKRQRFEGYASDEEWYDNYSSTSDLRRPFRYCTTLSETNKGRRKSTETVRSVGLNNWRDSSRKWVDEQKMYEQTIIAMTPRRLYEQAGRDRPLGSGQQSAYRKESVKSLTLRTPVRAKENSGEKILAYFTTSDGPPIEGLLKYIGGSVKTASVDSASDDDFEERERSKMSRSTVNTGFKVFKKRSSSMGPEMRFEEKLPASSTRARNKTKIVDNTQFAQNKKLLDNPETKGQITPLLVTIQNRTVERVRHAEGEDVNQHSREIVERMANYELYCTSTQRMCLMNCPEVERWDVGKMFKLPKVKKPSSQAHSRSTDVSIPSKKPEPKQTDGVDERVHRRALRSLEKKRKRIRAKLLRSQTAQQDPIPEPQQEDRANLTTLAIEAKKRDGSPSSAEINEGHSDTSVVSGLTGQLSIGELRADDTTQGSATSLPVDSTRDPKNAEGGFTSAPNSVRNSTRTTPNRIQDEVSINLTKANSVNTLKPKLPTSAVRQTPRSARKTCPPPRESPTQLRGSSVRELKPQLPTSVTRPRTTLKKANLGTPVHLSKDSPDTRPPHLIHRKIYGNTTKGREKMSAKSDLSRPDRQPVASGERKQSRGIPGSKRK